MKAQTRAIIASVVVIALALSAISGVTYSWFSDSEEATIDVNTAKVDYQVEFKVDKTSSATGSITGFENSFSISNMAPYDEYTIKTSSINNSTIQTVYRVYVQCSTTPQSTFNDIDAQNIAINGISFKGLNSTVTVKDWTSLNAESNPEIPDITITVLDGISQGRSGLQLKVFVDAYQGNYVSPVTPTIKDNSVSVSDVKVGPTSKTAEISVSNLPSDANEKEITLALAMNDANSYTVSASINGITTFENPVSMKVVIPGDVAGANVIYLGTSGEQPSDVSTTYDATTNKTTIEFKTNHFSEFMISKDVVVIADTESGVGVFTNLSDAFANVKSGGIVKLVSDVTVDSTITVTKNVELDLNGKTITGNGSPIFYFDEGVSSITGSGKIVISNLPESKIAICVGDPSTKSSSLTIGKDVVIESNQYGIVAFGPNVSIVIDGTVTTKDCSAVSGNGSKGLAPSDITINGKVTTENGPAVYHPQNGKLTVNGTVIGGIEAKAGSIIINDGATVESNSKTLTHVPNGNGTSTDGYAIAIVSNDAYDGPASLTFSEKSTITGIIAYLDDKVPGTENSVAYVSDINGLRAALNANIREITVMSDIKTNNIEDTVEARLIIKSETVLNLNGMIISPNNMGNNNTNFTALIVSANTIINASDKGGINTGVNGGYGINVKDGATLTINGGDYYGGGTAVQVQKGTLIINNGNFDAEPYSNPDYGSKFLINCYDPAWKDGTAKIMIKGGTFVNFDPSDSLSENPHGNFVVDGYSVISQDKDSNKIYTVVKGSVVSPSTQDKLNEGIKDSEKDVNLVLSSNTTFNLDNGIANEGDKVRNVTFFGDGTQTVDVVTNATKAEGGELNYQRGSTFAFKDMTIQAGEGNFDGIVCDELIFENCTIKGKLTLYGKATFVNCTFDNTMANQYSIWTWGGTDVTFENCTFNTNGKAILLYGQATEAKPTNLVVKDCTFNDRNNGSAGKAAIEIGNDYNATYTLAIEDIAVNGFADGKNTGSKLWANKNSMDAEHLTVTIDGVKIQ